jgi:transcriptional regulator with XRE-family HTH domain
VRRRDGDQILRDVGRRVAELRREHGWTQEQLGERGGVSRHYIQGVEVGRENLTLRNLSRIASLLGVDARELLEPPTNRAPGRPGRPRKEP